MDTIIKFAELDFSYFNILNDVQYCKVTSMEWKYSINNTE